MPCDSPTSHQYPDAPMWTPLTQRVWTTAVEPESVTCGLVVGTDHALLVDTGSDPEQGRALAQSAARACGLRVDRVVVTHHHDDHAGGLGGVGEAEVWMHEAAVARREGLQVDHPISLLAWIDLGGTGVEVLHPGTGHTDGDLVVIVRDEGVTFVGDLVETAGDPQSDESTDQHHWPSAIDSVITATGGHGTYVPGHGPAIDATGVMEQRGWLADQIPAEIPLSPVRRGHLPPGPV